MDCCGWLLGATIVLGLVTLIGHGLWVALAAFFRALGTAAAAPAPPRSRARRRDEPECVGCGRRLRDWEQACPVCGLVRDSDEEAQLHEIDMARRQIAALRRREEIDAATAARVLQCLNERRQTVLGTPAVAPPPPPLVRPAAAQLEEVLPVEQAVPHVPPPLPLPRRPEPTTVPPPAPRRPLRGMLTAFMEEKNILWGELVGGLLIVGCSIALVLTLWGKLEQLPYFPFLLFSLLTAALFGAGQYTLHHWKLTSTSRGLLVIALLLVPLDLLVLAGPTGRGTHNLGVGIDWAVAAIAVALGTLAAWVAGRDLIGTTQLPGPLDRRWLLALVVVGTAATQLFVPLHLDDAAQAAGWAWAPLGAHLLACAAVLGGLGLYGRRSSQGVEAPQAVALFSFLGVASFALLGALAYLQTRLDAPLEALHALALPLVVAGVPGLAAGLLVYRQLEAREAGLRTGGTAIALAGAAAMFAGVALAWPDAGPLLGALIFAGLTLVAGAVLARAPWLHGASLPALVLAVLVGYPLLTGTVVGGESSATMLRVLTAPASGVVLGTVALVLAALAVALGNCTSPERQRGEGHAGALGIGAIVTGALALLIATGHGLESPIAATVAHGLAGLAALLLVWWPGERDEVTVRPATLAHIGVAVLLAGSLWLLHAVRPDEPAVWGLVVGLEALALSWAALALRQPFSNASAHLALLAMPLALGLALASRTFPTAYVHTFTVLALAGAVLARAAGTMSRAWFITFQLTATGAALCAVTATIAEQPWLLESAAGFLDPRALQSYGLAIAGVGLLWVIARQALGGRAWAEQLWPKAEQGVEDLSLGLVVIVQLILAALACLPGVLAEWSRSSPSPIIQALEVAHEWRGWALLGALALPLALQLRGATPSQRQFTTGLLTLLFLTVPLLYAGWHAGDLATASALRWGLAVAFVAGSAVVWCRVPLVDRGQTHGLLGAAAVAVVVLSVILANIGFQGLKPPGPIAESAFARMGVTASSIGPLALVVLALVGNAARERSTGYALAGGLLATASVMGGYALGIVTGGGTLAEGEQVTLVLLGCLTAALAALAWLAGRERVGTGPLLAAQAWLGLVGQAALAGIVGWVLMLGPAEMGADRFAALGGWLGWVTLALTTGAAAWHTHRLFPTAWAHVAGAGGAAAGLMIAALTAALATADDWASYHALVAAWASLAAVIVAAGSLGRREGEYRLFPSLSGRIWLSVLAGALVLLAVRGGAVRPVMLWSPMGAMVTASVLLGAVAWWASSGGFVYASGIVFALAGALASRAWGPALGNSDRLLWIALALALAGAFWQWAERGGAWLHRRGVAFAHSAGPTALLLVAAIVGVTLLEQPGKVIPWSELWLYWASVAAVGLCLGDSILDERPHLGRLGLYALGIVVVGLMLVTLRVPEERLVVAGALGLAAHALAASAILCLVFQPRAILTERKWIWLLPVQALVAAVVVTLALGISLDQPRLWLRLAGPGSVALLACAAALLAPVARENWREGVGRAAGGLGLAAVGLVAWASVPLEIEALWLHRNAWLLVAWAGCAALGLEGARRWRGGQALGAVAGALAVVVLAILLLTMLPWFDPLTRRTPLDRLSVAAVALAVAGLIALALRWALARDGGPWGWPESRRTGLVYLSELLGVLLFVHVRLNVPELFAGWLARYWTLIVMLVAFAGVGLAELFERRGLRVLAVPLQRTGALLPLIPLLFFWARPPAALLAFADEQAPGLRPMMAYLDRLPWRFDSYALLWALASGVYIFIALTRRSFAWAVVAALAANFALWSLYANFQLSFLLHPQAWLIPPALLLLIAAQLNRERLSPGALEGLRYLGISMIYVASTAELFLVGLGKSVWLPIVLAVLSVAGVLVGILMRVRAFLFLGVTFLLVDILSMIWHAAVNQQQTWLWWASGIVLGAMILALFAVFEKRRNDVLRLVEEIKGWR